MKKLLSYVLSLIMVMALLIGCSNNGAEKTVANVTQEPEVTKTATADEAGSGEVTKLTYWHQLTGDEEKVLAKAVDVFNQTHTDIQVEATSVSDTSKYLIAMSSDEAPDVIRLSNATGLAYYSQGLIEGLNSYIEKDGFDTSVFNQKSLDANTIDGAVVALPTSAYTIQMFYNKDILEKLGYTEPPKTMDEMYEMAVAATTLDADGNIDVLGYPLFPFASARQELVYGFGGRWWDENGNPTPTLQGNLDSLTYNVKYRKQFGIDKVAAFITTSNTNRYTEMDMFFAGKQLFRFDGPWLATMIKNYNSDVNYGIAMIPGTTEELRGSARFESNSFMITKMSKNKEAAWEFIRDYSTSEAVKEEVVGTGNLPAYLPLYEDKDMLAAPGFPEFMEIIKTNNAIQYPAASNLSEYVAIIDEYLDYIYYGTMTPEEGLNGIADRVKSLVLE